jgi:hypothetical protein
MDLDALLPFLIFAGIAGLLLAGGAWNHWQTQQRRKALSELADALGLSFQGEDNTSLWDEFAGLPLFTQGRSKTVSNRIQADTDEVSLSLFDYRYTTGSGKSSQTHRQTVACFQSPQLNLPQFEIRPQSLLHGIGKVFGVQDIDFASHPRFSKSFLLRGAHEQAIRRLFTGPLLSFLETQPQITIEGRGHQLLVYRAGKRVNPEQIRDFMGEAFAAFRQFRDAAAAAATAEQSGA